MKRVLPFFLLFGGCSARTAIPTVSIHALAVLHQRGQLQQQRRGDDFALQVRLSFATELHKRAAEAELGVRARLWDVPCAVEALCDWARLSEESTLTALGVAP